MNGSTEDGSGVGLDCPAVMPGVLKRTDIRGDSEVVGIATDERLRAMPDEGTRKRKAAEMVNGGAQLNGDSPATNGVYANGIVADPAMSPEKLATFVGSISSQLPPEIEHITQGYLPLSRLIKRLTQDTFIGLTEVINEMADMEVSPKNGVFQQNGAGASQAAQINIQKKTRLWVFAHDQRAKFIKVLVLSQWSRQSEAVSKVIDINYWMEEQKRLYKDVASWIGELKRMLAPMKMPSPDLTTALEALSTGKAQWLPDVGLRFVIGVLDSRADMRAAWLLTSRTAIAKAAAKSASNDQYASDNTAQPP